MLSLPLLPLSALCYFCYHQLSRVLITSHFVHKQISPHVFFYFFNNLILLQLLALIASLLRTREKTYVNLVLGWKT